MWFRDLLSRVARAIKDKGVAGTALHACHILRRRLVNTRFIVYSVDLNTLALDASEKLASIDVVPKRASDEFSDKELREIYGFRDPGVTNRHFKERFDMGAWMWLVKCDGETAGYVWTIQGSTMEPYFFPLGARDVHFFDTETFIPFRGRGINGVLMRHAMQALKEQNLARAYGETRCWNKAEQKSLEKTQFRRIALARKFCFMGKVLTVWSSEK